MTLSEVIKITRQKALLSQEDFAKAIDVSLHTIAALSHDYPIFTRLVVEWKAIEEQKH
ncbi:MAG: hypothetical protein IIY94_03170 [Oscillospiraceae bacterium]|nr:hypothetical protein [Oscillospiraceae bacterium]